MVKDTIQTITSASTSISTINKIYKLLPEMGYKPKTRILDFGCGKYDKNEKEAEKHGYIWLGYDPYNRSNKENKMTLDCLEYASPHIIICSNVLNVIQEDNVLMDVLGQLYDYADDDTDIYITIYEGNKSGIGKVTTKGYQRNQKLDNYKDYILEFFDVVDIIKPNILKCRKVVECDDKI